MESKKKMMCWLLCPSSGASCVTKGAFRRSTTVFEANVLTSRSEKGLWFYNMFLLFLKYANNMADANWKEKRSIFLVIYPGQLSVVLIVLSGYIPIHKGVRWPVRQLPTDFVLCLCLKHISYCLSSQCHDDCSLTHKSQKTSDIARFQCERWL